jgi:hypothetical protein
VAAKPTADLDPKRGNGPIQPDQIVEVVYAHLRRKVWWVGEGEFRLVSLAEHWSSPRFHLTNSIAKSRLPTAVAWLNTHLPVTLSASGR